MVSTSKSYTDIWEEAVEFFGQDMAVIVEGLLILGRQDDNPRVFLSTVENSELNLFENWILTRVGLPEWLAPNLIVILRRDNTTKQFLIGEIGESTVCLTPTGQVTLIFMEKTLVLNSNMTSFLKTIILLDGLIFQARLICGSNAFIERQVPEYLIEAFRLSIDSFDIGYSDAWSVLAGLSSR